MNNQKHIESFTVLEMIIVLIFLGLISTFIYSGVKKINEQLRFSEDISTELNNWITIRSQLYQELYFCDSMHIDNQFVELFLDEGAIRYQNEKGKLWRSYDDSEVLIDIPINSIHLERINGMSNVVFEFKQKNKLFTLSFPSQKGISKEINEYFNAFI